MTDGVKHLLYLLPDVAYAVELVPGKDGAGYAIRDYLQVNGEFMDDNEILPDSMEKLVTKLQPRPYDLILPDFLFTNTVVNVKKTGEEAVKQYIDDELIPSLEISKTSHSIQAFILTELKGSSKVQLAALEKSLLNPVRKAFGGDGQASISKIYPLSWTLKSLISLEPSISIVQLGANLYLAQHYIGVDQANNASAEDAEKLVETVKTLKGAEASIQTLYLLSSALVEQKLKDGLKDTLPLQQLADDSVKSEMPSYVKQAAEAGAKTLAIVDYKVPVFIMEAGAPPVVAEPEVTEPKPPMKKLSEKVTEVADLPTPSEVDEVKAALVEPELKFADAPAAVAAEKAASTTPATKPEPIDLAQFSNQSEEVKPVVADQPLKKDKSTKPNQPTAPVKAVIKNEPGTHNMVRMIFIGLASFFVTVGIGLGIGLGLLTFTRPGGAAIPTPTAIVSPTGNPTPTATPAPAINRTDQKVLVVNATTTAGYASQIADKLEAAGFKNVTAQNAKGDYEVGNYVLLEKANSALVELLSTDTGLTLKFAEGKTVEDSAGTYTVVVVLAE